jgi:ATP-dependent phosphofructokinase / diphosphate-dependent phosphofructokinase
VKTIGVMTGGGDCPGLNAAIRAVTARSLAEPSTRVLGFRNGWAGVMSGDHMALDRDSVRGILQRGGTILGTSRMDPFVHGDGVASVAPVFTQLEIDALIVIGGDGTLRTALGLADAGLPVVGIPKTIDNDIPGTDQTFGFDTAVQIATEAIDRITTTAEAHNRVMLVEVMGRTQGWIALHAGIASGADAILIPEFPTSLDEVADSLRERHRRGANYSVVVVAEGIEPLVEVDLPTDTYGFARLGGVSYQVAPVLERLTGFEARVTVLGHLQRGGTPSAADRVIASRLGVAAAEGALSGRVGTFAAVRGTRIVLAPLEEACTGVKAVPPEMYLVAKTFFG